MAQLSRAAHSWCVRQDALRRVAGSSPATSSSRGVPLHRIRLLQDCRGRKFLFDGGALICAGFFFILFTARTLGVYRGYV